MLKWVGALCALFVTLPVSAAPKAVPPARRYVVRARVAPAPPAPVILIKWPATCSMTPTLVPPSSPALTVSVTPQNLGILVTYERPTTEQQRAALLDALDAEIEYRLSGSRHGYGIYSGHRGHFKADQPIAWRDYGGIAELTGHRQLTLTLPREIADNNHARWCVFDRLFPEL